MWALILHTLLCCSHNSVFYFSTNNTTSLLISSKDGLPELYKQGYLVNNLWKTYCKYNGYNVALKWLWTTLLLIFSIKIILKKKIYRKRCIELLVLAIIPCLKYCRILNCQLQRSIAEYQRTSRFSFEILHLWLCLQFLARMTVPFKDIWINSFYFSFTMINTSTVQTFCLVPSAVVANKEIPMYRQISQVSNNQ